MMNQCTTTGKELPVEHKPFEILCAEYMSIIRRLRKECPWDRQQTHESLRTPFLEEAYEMVEAVSARDMNHLKNELGDLILHVALQAAIAEEEGSFTISDVLEHSMDKLVRRHPHVFGDTVVHGMGDVGKNWEMIKRREGKKSLTDGSPRELPALLRAQRVQDRASVLGFDWTDKSDVWKKVQEEIAELSRAERAGDAKAVEHEFGDLLFALVNYARFIGVSAEVSLRSSVEKFGRRFEYIEEQLQRRGKTPTQSSLEEMDSLWNEAKKMIG
jgi:MazG family protein